jgi:hypothetical protein
MELFALSGILLFTALGLGFGLSPFLAVFIRWQVGDPHPWRLYPDYYELLNEIYSEAIRGQTRR